MRERIVSGIEQIGADPSDSAELALQKRVLITSSVLVSALALCWGVTYIVFGEPLAGVIPFGFGVVSFAGLAVFARGGRFSTYRATQLGAMLVLPVLLQLSLGGFLAGSAVIVWSVLAPIGALLVASRRTSTILLAAFVALVVLAVVVQPRLRMSNNLPDLVVAVFFVLNLAGTAAVLYLAMLYFVGQKDRAYALLASERARSEALLLNVLPAPIAERLKHHEAVIADRCDAVSVMFGDIVDFTPMSARLSADELVGLLNAFVSAADDLARRYGLEKIRTIGDAYMVAAGIPLPRRDHAQAVVAFALELQRLAGRFSGPRDGRPLRLRIGIASGPAVAGVIGKAKFQYDVWGDTVNMASRMESHGLPGRVQVTKETYKLVRDAYRCEPRGEIDVKGKGRTSTWWIVDPGPRT